MINGLTIHNLELRFKKKQNDDGIKCLMWGGLQIRDDISLVERTILTPKMLPKPAYKAI